jgi:hypothetical protein
VVFLNRSDIVVFFKCQNDLKNTTMSEHLKNTTMSERFQKYHNVRTISKIPQCQNDLKNTTMSEHLKNTTMSERFQKCIFKSF